MPKFKYQVIDANGKASTGTLEANNIADATRALKADGKFIASIDIDKGPGILNMEIGSRKLNTKDLIIITRQLASLLSAGVTVIRSLDMLYQQLESKKAKAVIGSIYESIQSGKTLTESFKEQNEALPAIMINMIAAGEEAGQLDEVMNRLAEHFQKEGKTKNKISSALVYPKILIGVTVVITIALLTFVVPGIGDTIRDLGGDLPALTYFVMGISNSILAFWWLYGGIVVAAVIGFKLWKKSESGKMIWAGFCLKIPILGRATKMNASARFTRTVATLLKSGISVLQAVEITSSTLDNAVLEKKLYDARIEIRKGTSLSKAIKPINEFPPMIYAMTAIGEESGTLDSILEKAADFFEDEADAAMSKLVAAMEPLIICVMAVIVLVIVGAVAMPILSMASFINV
ncbi:MAG: type II secretion system F family protein [Clostridia bacterium]|nr:type II secretion system F family protein [Clostridia bacterium]